MCIVIMYVPVYDIVNFEMNLNFLIKPFPYITEKVGTKI